MKIHEGHLRQEKDDGPKKKGTHNRLGLLTHYFNQNSYPQQKTNACRNAEKMQQQTQ
jgi:hypothetical protein